MGYRAASLGLIIFGILGLMSIGLPFLMIGLAMLLLARSRHRPLVYWPIMLGLIAANVAYWLTVPFYCSASSTPDGSVSAATCSSLTGIPWPNDATGMNVSPAAFGISFALAIVVGIVTAVLVLSWLWMDRERRSGSARRASSGGL
jgi:hypothetical protein